MKEANREDEVGVRGDGWGGAGMVEICRRGAEAAEGRREEEGGAE